MPDENTATDLMSKLHVLNQRVAAVCYSLKTANEATASELTAYKTQVPTLISDAAAALKAEILGGAGEQYDTLKELADLLDSHATMLQALEAATLVSYGQAQTLTAQQKEQARTNIAAADDANVVKLSDMTSTITTAQKTQARTNIDAASGTDFTTLSNNAIVKVAQTLTSAEQEQARQNIGGASDADLTALETAIGTLTNIDFVSEFNGIYEPANAGA